MNRLANTKGAKELQDLLSDYKECRQLSTAGPLKIFTSDCLNIDGALWERTFEKELNENVVPYKGPPQIYRFSQQIQMDTIIWTQRARYQ